MPNELDTYFREAASWDIDRAAQTISRVRIAWIVAGAGWLCAMSLGLALALMMPLKRTEPYVVRVDNSTGVVDIVPLYTGQAGFNETETRYQLTRYVTQCEAFNFVTAERDYQECGAFHTLKRNQEWMAQWSRVNRNSPINLYKDGTTVSVQVTAITFFTRVTGISSLAQVRYLKKRRPPGGAESVSHWIATIDYAYVTPSTDTRLRQWNPLGFKILEFQSVAEDVPETTASLPDPTDKGTTR